MSDLQRIKRWLKTYPKINQSMDLQVDYYADKPENSSIAPADERHHRCNRRVELHILDI